jgi:hypothetical protein
MLRAQWLLFIAFALVLVLTTGRAEAQPPRAEPFPQQNPPPMSPASNSQLMKYVDDKAKERTQNTVTAIKIVLAVLAGGVGLGGALKRSGKNPR